MEQYRSSDIRNFAIVRHGASGKTSLAEAILMLGGEINRLATTIRSLTGGKGLHSESFSHYEKMPKEFEQKVIQNRAFNEDE